MLSQFVDLDRLSQKFPNSQSSWSWAVEDQQSFKFASPNDLKAKCIICSMLWTDGFCEDRLNIRIHETVTIPDRIWQQYEGPQMGF